jgi:hypothetical protein
MTVLTADAGALLAGGAHNSDTYPAAHPHAVTSAEPVLGRLAMLTLGKSAD